MDVWAIVGHFARGTLLEKFSRISLYVTDDAIAKLYVADFKFSQIGKMVKYIRHMQL